jgi:aldose 1-epimerase
VGVAPDVGGSLTHFRWVVGTTTHDWLRPASAADLAGGNAARLASFPLVPFSNRIRDGSFEFGGRPIRLPPNRASLPHAIHGHGWQARWRIAEQGRDRIALEYDHPADAWPWPYVARQQILLVEDELRLGLAIDNRGEVPMPTGLGWHPYFPRSPQVRLRAPVAAMWATDPDGMPTTLAPPDSRLVAADGLPIDAVPLDNVFTEWRHEAIITWPEREATLAMLAGAPIDFLVVYSPPQSAFFCVEPVSHCTDAVNLARRGRADTGLLTLAPGASLRVSLRLRPALGGRLA